MKEIILKTKGITKRYKKQEALKDMEICVEKNTVYGLLGPNGAGKSTLLKIIMGIIRPTEGEVFFDGHKFSRKDLEDISGLIETAPLYENLTAIENLKVRTIVLGLPDSRIDEVLKIVGLENTGKKKAKHFSMGMKQRLGIAIALLNNPKLLILDEPTNGLDPFGIQELRELIKSFPQKGITVIISSHILSEIEQVAQHIGIISGGILGYQGEIDTEEDLESLFVQIVGKHRREV